MVIHNVSVQFNGIRFPPDIMVLILCDYIWETFKYHGELLSRQSVMSLQPIMLTIFPPSEGGCSEGALNAFRAFFKQYSIQEVLGGNIRTAGPQEHRELLNNVSNTI